MKKYSATIEAFHYVKGVNEQELLALSDSFQLEEGVMYLLEYDGNGFLVYHELIDDDYVTFADDEWLLISGNGFRKVFKEVE